VLEAVRSAILATAWLLVIFVFILHFIFAVLLPVSVIGQG